MGGPLSLLAFCLAFQEDGVNLARHYKAGEKDVYSLSVSPPGRLSPMSNPEEITITVGPGGQLTAAGTKPLAKWTVSKTGYPIKLGPCAEGFNFLPWALVMNDTPLAEGQMQTLPAGSVKLLVIKDSAAQLKTWLDIPPGYTLQTRSLVEVAGRVPDQIDGTLYKKASNGLIPWRAFRLERIRTRPIPPVPQDGGD